MNESEKVEFGIQLGLSNATDQELDRDTRQPLSEMLDLNMKSAELSKNEIAPQGSTGDPKPLPNYQLL